MNNASNILFVIEIYNKSAATKIHILSFETIKVIKLTKYILILQIKYNVQSIKLNHSIFAFQLQNHKTSGQPIQQLMASFCYHMHMSRYQPFQKYIPTNSNIRINKIHNL